MPPAIPIVFAPVTGIINQFHVEDITKPFTGTETSHRSKKPNTHVKTLSIISFPYRTSTVKHGNIPALE